VLIYIDAYAFADCTGITTITFPDSLAYIGNSAFKGCLSLSDVTFGRGELQIADYAFENCKALLSVTIPDNVTSIGHYAFALRESNSNDFSHNITITCSSFGAGASYVKLFNVPAIFVDMGSEITIFGDITGDGIIDSNDAIAVLRIAAGLDIEPTAEAFFTIDLNSNGVIDTGDSQLILKKVSGLI
jgi:hypothetical protein